MEITRKKMNSGLELKENILSQSSTNRKVSGEITQGLTFLIWRGYQMGTNCVKCPDYVHRQENAELLESAFGQSGVWNYKTCHSTCWADRRTKQDINSKLYYDRRTAVAR
jgi:hypothetical protein